MVRQGLSLISASSALTLHRTPKWEYLDRPRRSSVPVAVARKLWRLGLFALVCAGCTSRGELRLWPLLDIERPPEAAGPHVEVLWPLFEVDRTDTAPTVAVRPFYGFDSSDGSGWFLGPFGSFQTAPLRAFSLWPIYTWRESSHHALLPLAGWWRADDAERLLVGPGLYYRVRDGERRLDATLLPPFAWRRDPQESLFGLGPYWHHRTHRTRNDGSVLASSSRHVLFPLAWWQHETRAGQSSVHRELFPLVGYEQQRSGSALRHARLRVLWPLVNLEWGPAAGTSGAAAYLVHWQRRDGRLSAFAALPFWSWSSAHLALPPLGWARWDTRLADSAAPRAHAGWLSWPFASHAQRWRREEPGAPLTFDRDRWSFASGLVGRSIEPPTPQRPRRRHTTWLWPLFEHRVTTSTGFEAAVPTATRWRFLAGLVRSETDPARHQRHVAPLYPLVSFESGPYRIDQTLFPFYSLRRAGPGRATLDLDALLGLICIRTGQPITTGPATVLAPFSYRSDLAGDSELRVLWRLFEHARRGPDRQWGLHPLFSTRSGPQHRSWLLLGGLLGHRREGTERALRALWFWEVPLSRVAPRDDAAPALVRGAAAS